MSVSKVSSKTSTTVGPASSKGTQRGAASSVASGSTGTGSKKTSSQHRRNSSSSSDNSSNDELDAEDSLESQLVPCLASCSRQRMRAIHMALKRQGNNDNRISSKDFYAILTEYGIKFTPRVVQIIQETFEDNQGIQFEKIFKCMEGAHQRTGRDSVDAALARNDLQTRKTTKTVQEWTEELISRVEEQVSRADVFLDFEDLRHRMDEKDSERTGLLSKQDLMTFCNEPSFPVYGALLNAVVKHCESDSEAGRIRWQDFCDLLERGQSRFTAANPDMRRASSKAPKGGIIKGPGDQPSTTKKKATVKMSVESTDDAAASNATGTGEEGSNFTKVSIQPMVSIPSNVGDEGGSGMDAFDAQGMQKEDAKIPILNRRRTWGHQELSDSFKHLLALKHHEHHGETSDGDEEKKTPQLQHHVLQQKQNHEQQRRKHHHTLLHLHRLHHQDKAGGNHHEQQHHEQHHGGHSSHRSSRSGPNHVRLMLDDHNWEQAKTDLHGHNTGVAPHPHKIQQKPNHDSNKPGHPIPMIVRVVSGTNVESHVQVFRPHDYKEPEIDPAHAGPKEKLHLQWVYGYRGNDCRNSLHVLGSGELCYFIANIVILYSPYHHTQRFYRGHTDEIKCINMHPKRIIMATGQNGYDETIEFKPWKQAVIRVWRSDTLETIAVLGGGMMVRSILCIAFHPDKDFVGAIDAGPLKFFCLWDFRKGTCLTSYQIRADMLCDMAFSPKTPEVLVTCGKDHLFWWKINPEMGTFAQFQEANFQGYPQPKYIICMTHSDKGELVTGDSNGNILVWGAGTNKITNICKGAHEGSVYSLCFVRNSLVSSGRDGMVCNWLWATNLERVGELKLPDHEGAVRTICFKDRHFIFGTTTNSILTAPITPGSCPLSGTRLNAMPVTQGHFDALHGLGIPRVSNFFFTAGADGILLLFDAMKCRPIFKYVVPEGGILPNTRQDNETHTSHKYESFIAADMSADARTIALGTKDTHVIILNLMPSEELVQECREKLSVSKISIIRISNDAQRVAVGSSKGEIFIFARKSFPDDPSTTNSWEITGLCCQPGILPPASTLPLAVTSIDWTADLINDCYFLRATFHNTEYAIFNASACVAINPIDAVDYSWATNTILLAWDRSGVFEHKATRETGVRNIDVHPVRHSCIVASDYATNKLTLFRFPCTKGEWPGQPHTATLEISSLRFTAQGDYVITVGGKDSAIMQWKVQ